MSRAFTAVIRGDTLLALSDSEWFDSLQPPYPHSPYLWYGRLVIAGALGSHDRVAELTKDGYGQWDFSWYDRVNMFFDPIRDRPDFQELMRPKG